MADDPEENEDEEEDGEAKAKPKMGLLKLGLFIGLPAIILLLAGVAGFMMFAGGGEEEAAQVAMLDEHGEPVLDDHGQPVMAAAPAAAEPEHEAQAYYFPLRNADGAEDPIITNIRSTDGRPVTVMLKITLESSNAEFGQVIDAHIDPIMDQFIMFLRELREDDLYGSAGMHRVRLELLRRVNLAIEPEHADAVLIQEFMIVD
ncbi:flagellar basal body-associated FliL family protein [uncultured Maricaulis sp.]|uniref:flagellar basal body-associated FliL family protein n=1 Tax=uncultured Maricaulis sp. TaxID=174710 RepID=UPI0030DB26AB|tara:strand:- start:21524 stop:22132 length:609 start_codon:yes stop_codon:yes gene_type:complete